MAEAAVNAAAKQIDTFIEIVTPENIAFEYRVAGPFRRLGAYLIDVVIRVVTLIVLGIAAAIAGFAAGLSGLGIAAGLFLWFMLDWFYGGLFESYWNGQTPGKHMLRLRVVSVNGQPMCAWQAVLRNVLRAVDCMPAIIVPFPMPTFQVGLIAMFFNDRYQRLGDLASRTMVVVEEPQRLFGVARVTDPEAIRLAAYLPANFQVSRTLARALSNYVQRRTTFLPARRAEIAKHLGEPLRQRFNLPLGTSHDLLLCALYHLAFVANAAEVAESRAENPFMPAGSPFKATK